MPLLAAGIAFIVSLACIRLLLQRFGGAVLDRPNERSLHQHPVPRSGGIAIVAGIAFSAAFGAAELWRPLALALALAGLSFVEDVRGVNTALRLAGHVGAAVALVWLVAGSVPPMLLLVLVLAVAWLANLYNFMDGSDGLAGGMSVIGFSAYFIAAWLADDLAVASLCASTAAASAAFLLHNFHPARIFLGDVGSIPLGFLAGGIGVIGWRDGAWPIWFPLLVFAPFIGDATLTLAKRAVRGEAVWRAHREHYYQRLVRMGLGHAGTAWLYYGAMVLCAGAALLARDRSFDVQAAVFAAATLLLLAMAAWVDIRWTRFVRRSGAGA
ncbi:MAG TPA: glycosyl transferase [Burkholderiales bacterium]|nr:glycosyl transferase [Burkholderiales bacterium]